MNVQEPSRPARIRLFSSVSTVKLQEHSGSSLRNPTGTLVEIPAGVIVRIEGTVLWEGDAFSVFYEDLRQNGHILDSVS